MIKTAEMVDFNHENTSDTILISTKDPMPKDSGNDVRLETR